MRYNGVQFIENLSVTNHQQTNWSAPY